MFVLPVTLCAAAAAAVINIWLSIRVGQVRRSLKVSIGDDAGGPLTARMRAQLNFVENTAFVLILIAAIELSGRGGDWLAWVSAIYLLGRVAHGIGMDGGGLAAGRAAGDARHDADPVGPGDCCRDDRHRRALSQASPRATFSWRSAALSEGTKLLDVTPIHTSSGAAM